MTLKDAVNEAMREWTNRVDDTHYVLGSVMGPHPFPMVVRDFQSVIGKEIKAQLLEKEGRLPDVVMACVGGGSNAMGAFYDFIGDESVQLIGISHKSFANKQSVYSCFSKLLHIFGCFYSAFADK